MSDKPVYQRHIQDDDWQEITEYEFKRDSMRSKYKTRILCPASAYEALKAKVECLEGQIELEQAKFRGEAETVKRVVAHSEALKKQLETEVKAAYQLILDVVYLKKQNEAQAKRIAELEKGLTEITEWTKRYTSPGHPISTVADRLLAASKNGDSE